MTRKNSSFGSRIELDYFKKQEKIIQQHDANFKKHKNDILDFSSVGINLNPRNSAHVAIFIIILGSLSLSLMQENKNSSAREMESLDANLNEDFFKVVDLEEACSSHESASFLIPHSNSTLANKIKNDIKHAIASNALIRDSYKSLFCQKDNRFSFFVMPKEESNTYCGLFIPKNRESPNAIFLNNPIYDEICEGTISHEMIHGLIYTNSVSGYLHNTEDSHSKNMFLKAIEKDYAFLILAELSHALLKEFADRKNFDINNVSRKYMIKLLNDNMDRYNLNASSIGNFTSYDKVYEEAESLLLEKDIFFKILQAIESIKHQGEENFFNKKVQQILNLPAITNTAEEYIHEFLAYMFEDFEEIDTPFFFSNTFLEMKKNFPSNQPLSISI